MVSAPASGSKVVAKITNTVDYEDNTAVEGGSAAGSYITKPISLQNASTALDIRVAASVRSTSGIRAYYKISGGDETRRIEDIPYTINGKKVEIAVKNIIEGKEITNKDALSNPESLDFYKNILELDF